MDVILVVNAGSSSIKFHAFSTSGGKFEPIAGGKLEEIYSNPRFQVKRQNGEIVDEKRWPEGERLGHDNAIAFLLEWLRSHAGDATLLAVGHRVVHGGERYSEPVRVDDEVLAQLETLVPLAPPHQSHNLAPIGELVDIMDVGYTCAFLATPYARRTTGNTIFVDGGVSIMTCRSHSPCEHRHEAAG
jgi:acetate kinase